jgi:hypothetical protein
MTVRRGRIVTAALVEALVIVLAMVVLAPRPAAALPSYARQTGQPCGACHTDFPALTPFGRRFKLFGYTTGGGPYRTTIFPDSSDWSDQKPWVPPVSIMGIEGYTHQAGSQPSDNTQFSPFSIFWGGAITDHIGAFAQATNGGNAWTWDNTDVRYANQTNVDGVEVAYGITANNNPTVQDLWNTTPAWTFPYAISSMAGTPAAGTIIDGAMAAHVGSVGAYTDIGDLLYLEASAYRTLDFKTQNTLGVGPLDSPGLFQSWAPYWRAAVEPHWGRNWWEFGTFGMVSSIHPWTGSGAATFPQTDHYVDYGVDSQYQYQGDEFWLTLRGSYIHETQTLNASFANGNSANAKDDLNTLRAQASFTYGSDNRISLTGQYFDTWGSPDAGLYGGLASGISPNSSGWTAEIAYLPFMATSSPIWPWFNARIGLQYTWYNEFDGTRAGASANNTLFLYAWFAM